VSEAEAGTAPIPAPGDGAENGVGGAAPGPQGRETPDIRSSDERKPRRGRGERSPCIQRELRKEMYVESLMLYKEGLGYRRIVRELLRKYGVSITIPTLSYWLRGIHTPYGPTPPVALPAARPSNTHRYPRSIDPKPSPELAYLIGATLGDGSTSQRGYKYTIILRAKDVEFVSYFASCLTIVLGRPVKMGLCKTSRLYYVTAGSKMLYELLKKPVDLDRLKSYIEHCEKCTVAFLKGFLDAEGSVHIDGVVSISNTNLPLLIYVRKLLRVLGIKTTGIRLSHPAGRVFKDPRIEKIYVTKKDAYRFKISKKSNLTLLQKIGFTIHRKRKRLKNTFVRQATNPSPHFLPL